MSRPGLSRSDRAQQMSKQEELIAKKRLEILEKQKTAELAKAVAAAQSGALTLEKIEEKEQPNTIPGILQLAKRGIQNTFCNDGSFLTHFKKILDQAKKENEAKEQKAESENVKIETEPIEAINAEVIPEVIPDEVVKTSLLSTPPPPPPPPVEGASSQPAQSVTMPPVASSLPGPMPTPLVQSCASAPSQNNIQYNLVNTNFPISTPNTAGVPPFLPVAASHISTPYFNPHVPPPIMKSSASITNANEPGISISNNSVLPPAPPPPPPPPASLFLIPPVDAEQLSNIPPPKELDLNAIPKPEMNIEAIKLPENIDQVFSDNNDIFLPTTIESLIELVAENGDAYEDKIRTRKNDVHSSLWFLFDQTSEMYARYRQLVYEHREHFEEFEQQIQSSYRMLNAQQRAEQRNQNYSQMPQLMESNYPSLGQEQNIGNAYKSNSDEKYDPESVCEYRDDDSDDEYMKDMMGRNLNSLKRKIDSRSDNSPGDSDFSDGEHDDVGSGSNQRNRKRKSRWGGKVEHSPLAAAPSPISAMVQTNFGNQNKPILSTIQRTDPALLQYARQNYGTINLTEEDWKKCEEHFKVNLLYQDMMKKRQEIDQLAKSGKFKYEYDSDEDTTGGTWEHKLRNAEMEATQAWADALTEQSEGKHHIGDFLPPEELKKFMEKYDAKKCNRQPDLSDYKEYKLKEDNIGFQMLQKLGWKEGQGLGAGGSGIIDPVNKAPQRDSNQGLGAGTPSMPEDCDNEYEAYRKRMMLAYRFRPNPLNNPRRAYY